MQFIFINALCKHCFNRLAVCNSKLLSSYCHIDSRFRHLSYAIRSWATVQAIAGKSAFQLTKYAWTVMLVHFLQQCDPPVLPCLQERRTGNADECFIDGWDCYYDTEPLASFKRQNSSSLGMLYQMAHAPHLVMICKGKKLFIGLAASKYRKQKRKLSI